MSKFRGALLLAAASLVMTTITSAPSYADKQYGNFLVKGKIQEEYERTGGPDKWGNPTIKESDADMGGKFQRFAKNSSFYWQQNVAGGKANQIGGVIRDKWGEGNFERGRSGFPVSNETRLPRLNGAYNNFQNGSIYWEGVSGTGAHTVFPGKIRNAWAGEGYEGSYDLPDEPGHEAFGYPQSDEYSTSTGVQQDFERGLIRTVSANNAVEIVRGGESGPAPGIDRTKVVSQLGDIKRETCTFRATAEYLNKVVYITDMCDEDNIAPIARLSWKAPDGTTQNRYCVGSSTFGNTSRCQFVLTNAEGNLRALTAGLETDPGGDQPQYARTETFFVR